MAAADESVYIQMFRTSNAVKDQVNWNDWYCGYQNLDLEAAFDSNGNYLLTDIRGSVIVKADTDGTVTEISYDAWGTPLYSGDLEGLDVLWNGYYYDSETGNYYLRNRYYSPLERKFLTEDPHGINPDETWNNPFEVMIQYSEGLGLQIYAKCDPLNNHDFYGLAVTSVSGCPHLFLPEPPTEGGLGDWNRWLAFGWWSSVWLTPPFGDVIPSGVGGGPGSEIWFNHNSQFANRVKNDSGLTSSLRTWGYPRLEREIKNLARSQGNLTYRTYYNITGNAGRYYFNDWDLTQAIGTGNEDSYSSFTYDATCCVYKRCGWTNGKLKVECKVQFKLRDSYGGDLSNIRNLRYWLQVMFYKDYNKEISL